jgi:intracellular sulfur oxidation DsrE/DsrF family protein
MRLIRRMTAALALGLIAGAAGASSDTEVGALLAGGKPPPGVVFEIVSGDPRALEWAVPKVAGYTEKLRARFPELPIAVVTHGNEQFALKLDAESRFVGLHEQVRQLSTRENVPVHICATYAGMKGVAPEAFPKYVDVAPSGPSQIRSYRDLGYVLVRVTD